MLRNILLLILFLGLTVQAQSLFERWDKNKDGVLQADELPTAARRNFKKVDTDKNGSISRAEHQAFFPRRPNRGPALPEGTRVLRDLDYAGTKNPRHTLDLYLPRDAKGPLPLVVWVHGGGWRNGSKANARHLIPLLAGGKYVGASIQYRLTDEAQWPTQIHDCKAAIRWLRAHADEYHIDADKIAVWGSSAGGHLVAMLGVSQGVKGLEGTIGNHRDQSSAVSCVVNYYGPSELLTMNDNPVGTMDHLAPDSPESKLLGGVPSKFPERAASASPLTHVTKDDKPMLLVHGTVDPLVDYQQSVKLKQKLTSAKVPAVLLTVKGGGHGKGFGAKTTAVVHQFLNHHLLGQGDAAVDQVVPAE